MFRLFFFVLIQTPTQGHENKLEEKTIRDLYLIARIPCFNYKWKGIKRALSMASPPFNSRSLVPIAHRTFEQRRVSGARDRGLLRL